MRHMLKKLNKLKIPVLIIGIITIIIYYYIDYIPKIIYYLDFYFTAFLVTAINEFNLGNIGMGLLCIAIQIIIYLVMFIFVKITFIDTFFPRLRIVTNNKDVYNMARKIKRTDGKDPRYMYFYVKFHIFPLIRWHKLKIPKPEYIKKGIPFINRKKINLENGNKDIFWRRWPAKIDIITDDMELSYNDKEKCYEIGLHEDIFRKDEEEQYTKLAFDEVKTLGSNIIESVKGDWSLIKDQFHMGIVIREKDLPDEDVVKTITKPEIAIKSSSETKKNIEWNKKGLDNEDR